MSRDKTSPEINVGFSRERKRWVRGDSCTRKALPQSRVLERTVTLSGLGHGKVQKCAKVPVLNIWYRGKNIIYLV